MARKFMANGKQKLKLNFPDDETEMCTEKKGKTSKYIGVSYDEKSSKWAVTRWSKNASKTVHNGFHKNEETAANASDTLARKLTANGEENHKLNFLADEAELHPEK